MLWQHITLSPAQRDVYKRQGIYVFWNSSTSVVTSTEFGTGETNTVAMKAKGSIGLWSISEVQNGTWNGSSGWYVP